MRKFGLIMVTLVVLMVFLPVAVAAAATSPTLILAALRFTAIFVAVSVIPPEIPAIL